MYVLRRLSETPFCLVRRKELRMRTLQQRWTWIICLLCTILLILITGSPFRAERRLAKRSLSTWRLFTIDSGCIPRWDTSVLSPMSNKRREFPRSLTPQKWVKVNVGTEGWSAGVSSVSPREQEYPSVIIIDGSQLTRLIVEIA